jgi:PAS domain S-box-containing protein
MQKDSLSGRDKREETSLHAQAEAFRLQESVLSAMELAIFCTDAEGVITRVSRATEKLLGYSAADLTGKTTTFIFHEAGQVRGAGKQTSPDFNMLAARASLQSRPHIQERTLRRKDGSVFDANVSLVALRNEQGDVTGYAGMITELTGDQRLREQLASSERKFRLLAENIPGAIYLCHNDEAYSVIYLNDHIETITGYSADDFLSGKITFANLFHPEDKDMIYNTINACIAVRKRFHLRYRIRHAWGEWRWVDETGVGVFENDRLTMLEGFLVDITQQKEAEENFRKVAEENLRFFNNPVNLNAVVDFNGYLKRISPSWKTLLHWSEEELKSRPVMEFIHPDDAKHTLKTLQSISTEQQVFTFENRFACKDGSYRWLLWGSASDLKAELIYASAIDISERKKSEEQILDSKSSLESLTLQLQEQNRKLDEFAHIISHNLRAPVNNIHALINLLDDSSGITDYKLIFDKLKNVAKNLGETMNELMDTLKVKTEPHLGRTEIRFKEVLDKVVQSLEGELIVAEASVTFDFNDAPAIDYLKPYLESIFQNLLTNAIKYRSPNRKPAIHLRSYMVNDRVELQVVDNGQGIDMDRFGDKLFGLHKTFHDHKEARGVGLFLIKSQIEAMGGSISVESEVDKGTTFTIRFESPVS